MDAIPPDFSSYLLQEGLKKVMDVVYVLSEVVLGIANEGGVRNGSNDGLAASVAFRSIACPFLYTVKVMLFPATLC